MRVFIGIGNCVGGLLAWVVDGLQRQRRLAPFKVGFVTQGYVLIFGFLVFDYKRFVVYNIFYGFFLVCKYGVSLNELGNGDVWGKNGHVFVYEGVADEAEAYVLVGPH